MNSKERLLIFTLACVQFANIVDFMIMMPLGPKLMRIMSITTQEFSLVVAAYTLSAGVAGFLISFLIDRFDRKNMLLFIFSGFLIGTFGCGLAQSYTQLILARIFTGMFGGILGSLVLSIVGDAIAIERRGTAMGMVMAAFSVASIVGVPLSLYIADLYAWNMPFFFLSIMGIVVLALIFFTMPAINSHLSTTKRDPLEALKGIYKNKSQQWALLFMALLTFGQFTVIPFISPFMVSNVGFREDQVKWIYLLGGASSIITAPLVGKLSDKFNKPIIFSISIILSLIPLALITNMPMKPLLYALFVTTLFFICITGRMIPGMAMITSTVTNKNRGGFMSISSSVQQLTSGIAAYVAGLIVIQNQAGQMQNYSIVGYLALISSILTIFLVKRMKPIG